MNATEQLAPTDRPAGPQSDDRAERRSSLSDRMARIRSAALRRGVRTLFHLFTKVQVRGAEHIPSSGPCLIVINHVSNLDPPLIFATIGRSDTTALVASEYRTNAVYRRAIEWAGGSWIQRGASDRGALDFAVAALRDGRIVGIAPEGSRSKLGQLREGKPGPAFLAVHAGVPILPVGLTGTGEIAAGLKRLRRVPVTATFGPMFTLSPASGTAHKQYLQLCTNEIMCHIAALLPPEARGAYADAPRLRELLGLHESDRDENEGVANVP